MTADSMPAGSTPAGSGDPRQLLSEVRALTHRVRLDQRATWIALLALAGATFAAIPFDWFGMQVTCLDDGCQFARNGMLYFWVAGLPVTYAIIAFFYLRAAKARGLGTRVLPYAITGAATTVVFPAAWFAVQWYLSNNPVPDQPLPYWYMVLDRLVMPWGMIGVALLVLAWLERNVALLLFTVGYLAMVLLVLPMNFGYGPLNLGLGTDTGLRLGMAIPQLISGTILLLGAAGFAFARRRQV
jgi:hypothetical protein